MRNQGYTYDSSIREFPVLGLISNLFKFHELLTILVRKELAVRYKKSFIGVWWSLLNPLFTTAVLFYVFNTAFKNKIAQADHFIPYILCGVLVITFFNQSLTMVSDSILGNANIFTKLYVRPEMFGIAAAIASAINFLFGLIPLFLVAAWSGVDIGWHSITIVYVLFCLLLIAIGLGLLCSIAYIFFEDFRSIIQLLVMIIGYMTPVFYPIAVLGPHTRPVIEANPLTSVLAVFRSSFGRLEVSHVFNWVYSGIFSVLIFLIGVYIFEKLWTRAIVRL